MPVIKQVSDLSNYNEVLKNVSLGSPVFLTNNGCSQYAILDIRDYAKVQSEIKLMHELMEGQKSGDTEGWIPANMIMKHFMVAEDEN